MSEPIFDATFTWVVCSECLFMQSMHERWPVCAQCGHDNTPPASVPSLPDAGLSDERLAELEMVPVKCGFCRALPATTLVRINDTPVFGCEPCVERIVMYASRSSDGRTTT